jgi:dihydrodipicolinate synthase/N-acetylneuraminate lyase
MLVGMSPTWEGVYCALWTPTDDQGRLLEAALESNMEFLKRANVQGLLALGSTGEFLHLDPAQRKEIIRKLGAIAQPLQLMINVSDIRPPVVAELGRCARESGAAAISVLPPYFFPVAQEDLVEFFVRAAEAADLPLFLYNFPERTGNRIALETVGAVADRVPVAGVKQSGDEFGYHKELVQLGREKGFAVLTGADTRLPEAVAMGVNGCVSGLANAVPELVLAALQESRSLVAAPARPSRAAQRLDVLRGKIAAVQFPLDVAAVMEARGLPVGTPKSLRSAATQGRYDQLTADLRGLFQEWNLL